jgi:hypothetical protein
VWPWAKGQTRECLLYLLIRSELSRRGRFGEREHGQIAGWPSASARLDSQAKRGDAGRGEKAVKSPERTETVEATHDIEETLPAGGASSA